MHIYPQSWPIDWKDLDVEHHLRHEWGGQQGQIHCRWLSSVGALFKRGALLVIWCDGGGDRRGYGGDRRGYGGDGSGGSVSGGGVEGGGGISDSDIISITLF